MNQYQYLPLTKVHCYWGFLTFHLCAFNVLNRLPHDIWPSCLFGLFLAMAVSQCCYEWPCQFLFLFLLYKIVLVVPHINMNPPQAYTCSPSWTPLPPPSSYRPSRSSQCTSPKHPVSNLNWRFIFYMILYMSQCRSPKSSHPLCLPLSLKDCSIHLCLFCCLACRVIITIFLHSIYMC